MVKVALMVQGEESDRDITQPFWVCSLKVLAFTILQSETEQVTELNIQRVGQGEGGEGQGEGGGELLSGG